MIRNFFAALAVAVTFAATSPALVLAQDGGPAVTAVANPSTSASAVSSPDGGIAAPAATEKPDGGVAAPVTDPETVEDATKLVGDMVQAARDGKWGIFVGLFFVLLGWVFRKFQLVKQMPESVSKWVIPAVGIVAASGTGLAAGGDWVDVLINGVVTLVAAAVAVATGAPKDDPKS